MKTEDKKRIVYSIIVFAVLGSLLLVMLNFAEEKRPSENIDAFTNWTDWIREDDECSEWAIYHTTSCYEHEIRDFIAKRDNRFNSGTCTIMLMCEDDRKKYD